LVPLRSRFNLFDGPLGVLRNQGFCILAGTAKFRQGRSIANIPQRHANIAKKAASFGTQDGGAGKALLESGFIKGQQISQFRGIQVRARMGTHQAALPGKAVPGADSEAIVAAVDAIADGWPEIHWDGPFQFDGQVGNATSGIELERSRDGLGGTSREAAGA
jgi:hypothetical protein